MRSMAPFSPSPSLILFCFDFILRQRNMVEKNKWVAKFKRALNLVIPSGFILVEEEEGVGVC